MPRKLRVQFEGAISHVLSRGNARPDIVADDRDRRHFLDRLGSQVRRSGWELIRFVLLSNHFPLLSLRARGGEVDRDLDASRDRLRLPRDAR